MTTLRRIVKRTLDARGLTTAQWTPLGSAAAGDAYSTKTVYDGLGRKTEERRHLGTARGWNDGMAEGPVRLRRRGPDDDADGPEYGLRHSLQNQITEFAYDAQGRRTMRCLPDFRGGAAGGQRLLLDRAAEDAHSPERGDELQRRRAQGDRADVGLGRRRAPDGAHADDADGGRDALRGNEEADLDVGRADRLEKSTDENAEGSASADDDAIVRIQVDSLGRVR